MASKLVFLLSQLQEINVLAHEVFNDIVLVVDSQEHTINHIKKRIATLQHDVDRMETTFYDCCPSVFYDNVIQNKPCSYQSHPTTRHLYKNGDLFARSTSNKYLERWRMGAHIEKSLQRLKQFTDSSDHWNESAVLGRYSNTRFFRDQWRRDHDKRRKHKISNLAMELSNSQAMAMSRDEFYDLVRHPAPSNRNTIPPPVPALPLGYPDKLRVIDVHKERQLMYTKQWMWMWDFEQFKLGTVDACVCPLSDCHRCIILRTLVKRKFDGEVKIRKKELNVEEQKHKIGLLIYGYCKEHEYISVGVVLLIIMFYGEVFVTHGHRCNEWVFRYLKRYEAVVLSSSESDDYWPY
eukprot:154563_1